MLVRGISHHVSERVAALAKEYSSATPFPHVVIDGFFEAKLCDRLVESFPPFSGGCALNEQGLPGGKATYEDVRSLGPAFVEVDDVVRSESFLKLLSEITGVKDLIYDPDYVGGGTHENLPGQDLDPHVDFNYHPQTGLHRRFNAIIYLNEEWQEDWGGAIELHKDPWHPDVDETRRVLPLKNRCVLFETSERSWHGFQAIHPPADRPNLSRKSFAIYLYTRERPAEQTAPPHATVYVERPLPTLQIDEPLGFERGENIRRLVHRRVTHAQRLRGREEHQLKQLAGFAEALTRRHAMNLSEEHVRLLRELVAIQDALLASLYDREKTLSALLLRAERLRSALPPPSFPLQGAEEIDASGFWPQDQWAGRRLTLHFRPFERTKRIDVKGYLPDHAPEEMHLQASVANVSGEVTVRRGGFSFSLAVDLDAHEEAELVVDAAPCWTPETIGLSSDTRELAYIVTGVRLS